MRLARIPIGASRTLLVAFRRRFFKRTAVNTVSSIIYFALVLVLVKDQLHWSVVDLGMAQSIALITGFLTASIMPYSEYM